MLSLFNWIPTRRQDLGQQLCRPSDWQIGLTFFFRCCGTGGSGGGSKPWQRAATAESRNLPTNPCLWLALWSSCLFLIFLVNLPREHWIPSSRSAVCVQTVWHYVGDINHFNVSVGRHTAINPQSQVFCFCFSFKAVTMKFRLEMEQPQFYADASVWTT